MGTSGIARALRILAVCCRVVWGRGQARACKDFVHCAFLCVWFWSHSWGVGERFEAQSAVGVGCSDSLAREELSKLALPHEFTWYFVPLPVPEGTILVQFGALGASCLDPELELELILSQ